MSERKGFFRRQAQWLREIVITIALSSATFLLAAVANELVPAIGVEFDLDPVVTAQLVAVINAVRVAVSALERGRKGI